MNMIEIILLLLLNNRIILKIFYCMMLCIVCRSWKLLNESKGLNLACKNIFIVENKATVLSFPMMKESIVIFGSGYKVGILKDTKWLKNKEIYYWGDIDIDGFAILSQIRGYFPQIKSIFMDKKTFDKFKDFIVQYKQLNSKELKNLTYSEQNLYNMIENKRLEQEKIPFHYIGRIK